MNGLCIGMGGRGKQWHQWASAAGVNIVGVVDLNEEILNASGNDLGVPESQRFTTIAQAAAATDADIAVVCTANRAHAVCIEQCLDAGLHTLVESDHVLTDEVRLTATPGHTPGHVSVLIESQGERAVITGDIMHHPSQMARPDWTCTADTDSAAAVATRTQFLQTHADQPVLVIGTHFAAPTAGHVRRDGNAFRFDVS